MTPNWRTEKIKEGNHESQRLEAARHTEGTDHSKALSQDKAWHSEKAVSENHAKDVVHWGLWKGKLL